MAAQVWWVYSTRNPAGGVAATKSQPHDKPLWGRAPGALTLNSSSTAEARCIFLLNRGQFPLIFPSKISPLPLISSTSLARVSLSSLSILDTSMSAVNQQEGRQDSLWKVEIARLGGCLKMIKQQKERWKSDSIQTVFRQPALTCRLLLGKEVLDGS